MILHGHPISGNTHKVRLLLAALGVTYEEHLVDIMVSAHKQEGFLALNPRGQLPVLVDGDVRIHDSQAILVYLARSYDRSKQWLPEKAADEARVVGWLSFAANELQNGVHAARIHHALGVPLPIERADAIAQASLALLEKHLEGRPFLELGRPTIADLACFPAVGLAPEGKISLDPFPNVRAWQARVKALPFYVAMPGLAR